MGVLNFVKCFFFFLWCQFFFGLLIWWIILKWSYISGLSPNCSWSTMIFILLSSSLLGIFTSTFTRNSGLLFSVSITWYQDFTRFIKWLWKWSFLLYFLEEIYRINAWCNYLSKHLGLDCRIGLLKNSIF